jgi:capsular polysaccharide biosynthesis protein
MIKNISRPLPLNINDIDNTAEFLKPNIQIEVADIFTFKNALISPYGAVFHRGKVVGKSVYPLYEKNNLKGALTFFKKIFLFKVVRVLKSCIVIHNSFYNNYYHWTIEALPRLYRLKDYVDSHLLAIPAKEVSFINQYLDLLEINDVIKIDDDSLIYPRTTVLAPHISPILNHDNELIEKTSSWIKAKVDLNNNPFIDYKNVYISRSKAAYRKVINESSLINMLEKYSFKIINLEDLTVVEQIKLFHSAKNVVAVHGAGISNILYMQRGGLLINLINGNHHDPAFYNLANAKQLKYVMHQAEASNTDTRGSAWDNFTVDLDLIQSYLDKYLL